MKSISIKNTAAGLCLLLVMVSLIACGMTGSPFDKEGKGDARTYLIDISMSGGSGKAYIKSPVEVIEQNGKLTARLIWSSSSYDYMIVNGVRYENENIGGNSTFHVEIDSMSGPLTVIGDTTAMSRPHEIEYVITWGEKQDPGKAVQTGSSDPETIEKCLDGAGLSKLGTYELKYATGFSVVRYNTCDYLSIPNSGDYLILDEDTDIPQGIPESVVILKKPLDKTYLVSTSSMDAVNACGAMDMIALSGTRENDWYIKEAGEAMKAGQILYAGKYSAPDYELILESGCNLAIENTMIYHEPSVKEKLEELGIPVLVETSSYEKHPLGRLEWIKLYGILFDRETEAERFFDEQLRKIEPVLAQKPDTGKSVACFYVTAGGVVNVRRSGDYITKMIELAGGHYVPRDAGDSEDNRSAMNMQMEDFYEAACGADIILYNSAIGGSINTVEDLIAKNAAFRDFTAVKEGNVYCINRDLFQKTTGMAEFMADLNDVLSGVDREYDYLSKLDG